MRHGFRTPSGERGFVLVFFIFSLTLLLLAVGLAVDLGTAFVLSSRLSKAADAGALAGAHHAGKSLPELDHIVREVANANFVSTAKANFEVEVTAPGVDTRHVMLTARTESPAFFARLMGKEKFPIMVQAEAMRYPLDVSLVLDISYSLQSARVFDDMQDAAKNFVGYFEDDIDQFGVVTYSTCAEEQRPVRKQFKSEITSIIDKLHAILYTNIDDGLRLSKIQLDNAPHRDNAVKVAVLFTDGRPTAFADDFQMPPGSNPPTYDGVIVTGTGGDGYGGLYTPDSCLRIQSFKNGKPVTTSRSSGATVKPQYLPNGTKVTGENILDLAIAQSEAWADAMRAEGYVIFSIGLGNPNARNPDEQPDLDFLARLANVDGIANMSQPRGEMMFAPSAAELNEVFAKVADRILTRLTR